MSNCQPCQNVSSAGILLLPKMAKSRKKQEKNLTAAKIEEKKKRIQRQEQGVALLWSPGKWTDSSFIELATQWNNGGSTASKW